MNKHPLANCEQCSLRECPHVPSYLPEGYTTILVGEAPGYQETREGRPFVGPSGKLLEGVISGSEYLSLARTNICSCRPPGNREPTPEEAECCRPRLEAELAPAQVVVTLGMVARDQLVGDAPRGTWTSYRDKRLMPTWHPAYVLRRPSAFGDLERDLHEALRPSQEFKYPTVFFPRTREDVVACFEAGKDYEWWAVDTETSQLEWYQSRGHDMQHLLSVGFAWCEEYAVVLDKPGYFMASDFLNEEFAKHKMCAHNGKFDQIWLQKAHLYPQLDFDTMLAHYLLDENSRHGLKELLTRYFGWPDYEAEIQKYLRTRNDDYGKVPEHELAKYLACDCVGTLKLRELLDGRLHEEDLYEMPFRGLLMRASQLAMDMELRGICVDMQHLLKWQEEMGRQREEYAMRLCELAHDEFLNPNSWQQLGRVLWDERKLPINTKTKVYRKTPRSTNDEALEHLRSYSPVSGARIRDGDEFVDVLFEYRKVQKMLSSYVDNLVDNADVVNRVHPTILLHGTEVGRISMRDPAMQTIPRSTEFYGRVIRSSIVAAEPYQLAIVDYSQAELRVLACLSMDPFLLEVYKNERDLHSEVAAAMFGPNFTKEQRVMCKMFNFAYAYGGTEHSFAQDVGLPLEVARAFVHKYDEVMTVAKQWKLEQLKKARTDGYVQTIFGRKRRFPLITDVNFQEVRKACAHMPVAGTASDLTLMAAIELYEQKLIPRIVHLVHDSIIAEVRDPAEAEVIAQMMRSVGEYYLPEVPWKVDVEIRNRWSEPPSSLRPEREATDIKIAVT